MGSALSADATRPRPRAASVPSAIEVEAQTPRRDGSVSSRPIWVRPEAPTPFVTEHRMLTDLPRDAVELFVTTAGPWSGSSLLVAELRQLGGALARRPEHHGALPRLEGAFALYAGGLALDDDMALASLVHASRLASALEPWSDRRRHLNFEEHPTDAAVFYDEDTYARLRTIKAQVDPRSLIHANHSIQP